MIAEMMTEMMTAEIIAEVNKPKSRRSPRQAAKQDFHFVTVLPDGTEANMDDPAVCRALGVWIEYATRGMAVPTEIVRRAYGRAEQATPERREMSCG